MTIKNIFAAIDESSYLDSICQTALFISKKTGAKISVLHVGLSHEEFSSNPDLSGSIGVDAQSELLKELLEIDEKRGKAEQEKGRLILNKACKLIEDGGRECIKIHRRGSLSENIQELQEDFDLLILGKQGSHSEISSENLGSNIERVARSINKPILVVDKKLIHTEKSPKKFLLCYDSSEPSKKILNLICQSDILQDFQCHLVNIHQKNEKEKSREILVEMKSKLESRGFEVVLSSIEKQNEEIQEIVKKYIKENSIDFLAIGAFGHSPIRNFFLGSTTDHLIKETNIPVLMIH